MSPRMHLVGVSMLSVRLVIVCSFSQWLVLRFSFTFTEKMISNAQLQGVPLLVLANKQDLQVRQLYIFRGELWEHPLNCCNCVIVFQRFVKRTAYILTCMIYKILWNTKLEFIRKKPGSTFSDKKKIIKKIII